MTPSHLQKPEKPKKPNKPCWVPRKEYLQPVTILEQSLRLSQLPGSYIEDNNIFYDEHWNDVWDEEELQEREESVWLNGALSLSEIIKTANNKNIPLDNVYIGSFCADDYIYIHAFHQEKVKNEFYGNEKLNFEFAQKTYEADMQAYEEKVKYYDKALADYVAALEQEVRETKRELEDLA